MMMRRPVTVLQKHDAPRGVLNPDGRRADLTGLSRFHPSADLAPFVEHYWIVRWDLRGHEPRTQETLPHPSIHLVLERGRSAIYGVVKGKFSRVIADHGFVFGVKFRPGGFYPFIKTPVSRLTNRVVPADDIFGAAGAALEADVLSRQSDTEMVGVAEAFLRGRSPEQDPTAEMLGRIVEQIASDRTITSVETVATRCGLSIRSLQRAFSKYIGVSPKWVINRHRLHEVVDRLAHGETVDWTQLALDLGYFDQAHFIRDFKAIIGRTPGEYRNR
jgi:AraC-like DNA-binding protein